MILIREITRVITGSGICRPVRSTPSMRNGTTPFDAAGWMWISEAPSSIAF